MKHDADSLELKFNRMAEEPTEDDASARESRRNRTRGRVVDFENADPDTKARMEQIMEPIHVAPDSFEAIISYGQEPLETLGRIANDMIKVQGRFNDQVNVMSGALDQLNSGLRNLNLDKFGDATRKMLEGLAEGGKKAGKGIGRLGKGLWDSLTGKNKDKGDDEKLVEEMQNNLPTLLFKMIKLVDDLAQTEEGFKQVMKEAEKLGFARVEATREINLYVGAGKEVLRRYNEEYIPEANADFEETGDAEDEMLLKDIMKRKEQFVGRLTNLEGSRAQSVIAAQQLKQMMETMEDQRAKIQDILHNSQNEWKAMLAAAGIAGSSLKAAQTIKRANDLGDEMHDQTMKMIEEAHEMTQSAKSRGTIDPAKLIEASGRLQKLIEKENANNEKRLRELEATAQQLRGATDKLLDAADSANQARLLESVKSAEEDAARAKAKAEAKPVSNDNTDTATPQPEAAANDTPAEGKTRTRKRNGPAL